MGQISLQLGRSDARTALRAIQSTFTVNFKFDRTHRLFDNALGGAAILDLGCYPLSFARHIAGAAHGCAFSDPIRLEGEGRRNATTGADEYAGATPAFPAGITAQISCGSCVPLTIGARIFGTGGWIDVPSPFHPGNMDMRSGIILRRTAAAAEMISFPETRSPHAVEADAFAETLMWDELESPAVNHADTLGNLAALDTWRASVGIKYEGEG